MKTKKVISFLFLIMILLIPFKVEAKEYKVVLSYFSNGGTISSGNAEINSGVVFIKNTTTADITYTSNQTINHINSLDGKNTFTLKKGNTSQTKTKEWYATNYINGKKIYFNNAKKYNVKDIIKKLNINTSYNEKNGTSVEIFMQANYEKIIDVKNVEMNTSILKIKQGKTSTLKAIILPSNATDKSVTWSSENTSIATVDQKGNVKGIKEGSTKIVVKTADGGKIAKCRVSVVGGGNTTSKDTSTSTKKKEDNITISPSKITITVGKRKKVTSKVASISVKGKNIKWSSNNTKVATVDQNGYIKGVQAGNAVITVKNTNNKTATCNVAITNPTTYKINIKLNMNGGTLVKSHGSEISTSGNSILCNGNEICHSKNMDETFDIADYNNVNYINISRSGYHVEKGKEWNTKPDGSGTSYSQMERYTANNLCSNTNENCNITLYTRWVKDITAKSKYTISYNGKQYDIKGPKKLPSLTGRQGHDVILIAASQHGYKGVTVGNDKKRLSYYGNIWANKELDKKTVASDKGNWCSEFAAWCARQAGVPSSVYPAQASYASYRIFFSNQGRFFKFSKGPKPSNWFSVDVAGTMTPEDLQEGDILQIARKGENSPHHTAIFHKYKGGKIYTYDGNQSNVVKASGNGKYRDFDNIMAVIRPSYNDNLQVSTEKDSGGIRIHVAGLKPFTARKREYVISVSNTNISNYILDYDRKSVLFNKESRFKSGQKYTVTVKARYKNNGNIDTTFPTVTTTFTY